MYLLRRKPKNQVENDSSYQDAKVAELRVAIGPLSERSLKYCTDSCLRRYLVARDWDVDKSNKMLKESLIWRSTYKPEEILWPEVAHEGETGKVSRSNFHDKLGRTVLIMRPGMQVLSEIYFHNLYGSFKKASMHLTFSFSFGCLNFQLIFQNTASPENNIRHLVYIMENTILNLVEGAEQMSWLIDFTGFSLSTNIPIKTARDIVYILQNHYPERLAVAFLYNPPRMFQALFKAIKYFMDSKTTEKVKFVYPNDKDSMELMKSLFDIENLPSEFGGKATLKYDHQEFSRMMIEDDVKTAKFWGLHEKPRETNNVQSGTEEGSEPVLD